MNSALSVDDARVRVQSAYPRIYLACHSRHQNARTTPDNLSQRDASLLAHLHESHEIAQGDLARHMGVAKSTLSEAISGLEDLGYVTRRSDDSDVRGTLIVRSPEGTAAMSRASVLESDRLAEILALLTEDERRRAVEGLELIADACKKRSSL